MRTAILTLAVVVGFGLAPLAAQACCHTPIDNPPPPIDNPEPPLPPVPTTIDFNG